MSESPSSGTLSEVLERSIQALIGADLGDRVTEEILASARDAITRSQAEVADQMKRLQAYERTIIRAAEHLDRVQERHNTLRL